MYTYIIPLIYVCLSLLVNYRSQLLLDRFGKGQNMFVSTDSRAYIMSRVRVSVRNSIFIKREKQPKLSRIPGLAQVYVHEPEGERLGQLGVTPEVVVASKINNMKYIQSPGVDGISPKILKETV